MKTLNKIIKGGPDGLVIDFAHARLKKLLKPDEVEPFRAMLVAVFNAGRNGTPNKKISEDFEEFYKMYPRKMGFVKMERNFLWN